MSGGEWVRVTESVGLIWADCYGKPEWPDYRTVANGDRLLVRWPNGEETEEVAEVEESNWAALGDSEWRYRLKAYVRLYVRGQEVRVPLVGMYVKVLHQAKPKSRRYSPEWENGLPWSDTAPAGQDGGPRD